MKIERQFTTQGQDVFSTVEWDTRTSRISNPDGSVVFEMTNAEIPKAWSQLATDIMVSKYFRKAGVPQSDGTTGPETSARQVIHRLAGCWRHWGETHGYFDTPEDAQAFYDELAYMLLHQMAAPNSPQWFNTGLHFAYGITGPAQGHFFVDPADDGHVKQATSAYERPQPHACFIQSVSDDLVNPGGIMDLWTREARLFKYGSGTGTNFSSLRGENEALSGGGKSSGLMSFLKIGDRAAGAIKSGGTTRRAAKMVCLDLDHPDVESFVNWKVREEIKVACLVEGFKHIAPEHKETARKLGLKLDYDFNGESYTTVSGQNSNNSVRIPNAFFEALENDADWTLFSRTKPGKTAGTVKARKLWEDIAYAAWRCADPGVQFDTTINQWHTCPAGGRINASNPCVTGDMRVLTPGGIWRRIDQMIHLPARVVTNLGEQEIHFTEGSFPTGKRDVYELVTESGYMLKVTADHKIWTKNRGWVKAFDLTADDVLRLPGKPAAVASVPEPTEPELFQLAGLLASETNGSFEKIDLKACLKDAALVDSFANYAEAWKARRHEGTKARRENERHEGYDDDVAGDTQPSAPVASPFVPSCLRAFVPVLEDRRLISRLRAFVTWVEDERRLSDDAFTAGLAAQKHILRGLFTADGLVTDGSIEIRSDSRGLLGDVQMLLIGFGIKSEVRHNTLRIAPASLEAFTQHVGLLPGRGMGELAITTATHMARHAGVYRDNETANHDRFCSLTHLGVQQVFDLTEPVTSSFVCQGLTIHNCSEYMFLDDTACNLASLNVLKFFRPEDKSFDIERFKHACRVWTVVLEISVLMASFPSEKIAELSYRYRTLGLGYANLGAMLMQAGIPYDSDAGRAVCGAITAILTGESYATSAELARELGAFPGYTDNAETMLRVMRNHRRAAWGAGRDQGSEASRDQGADNAPASSPSIPRSLDPLIPSPDYEGLDILPVEIDASQFVAGRPLLGTHLLSAARACWDRALALGQAHGYRNAQATVIAPTGTIGLLMDCDTTGVEPDFALVKFKKLAGGGYFKIVNQSVRPALHNLGYTQAQQDAVITHVLGTLSLHGEQAVNWASLKAKGLTDAELEKINKSLPTQFELGFAFSPWSLSPETFARLNIPESEWQAPGFNLLRKLGFTSKQIEASSAIICGHGTVEGAPHLKPEHLPVFDCANKCGKTGTRYIAPEGHIHMMAAAQPFISGAISKTINLPHEATVEQIQACYELSWKLGLKANALYRDGSKLSQPLNIKSDEEIDEEEDDANVEAARDEVSGLVQEAAALAVAAERHEGADVAGSASSPSIPRSLDPSIPSTNVESAPAVERVIEKIVERVVHRPLRRRLPDTRRAVTHKFDVANHEGYITVGLYDDGDPGEVFITMAKEGSTIGGLMDTIATLLSVSLQYGVPVESLVRKFEHVRYEPNGMTRNPDIPMAKSLTDYIFRFLGMEFVEGYRAANAPRREGSRDQGIEGSRATTSRDREGAVSPTPTPTPTLKDPAAADDLHQLRLKNGKNGNGHKHHAPPPVIEHDLESGAGSMSNEQSVMSNVAPDPASALAGLRLAEPAPKADIDPHAAHAVDPLSAQGAAMQADAPSCDVCGSITVRSGTCYKCLNCGNSMGCS
ncbi:MAG: LAGLIDADG family homing endonuclease [Phycisphaerae bacterium]